MNLVGKARIREILWDKNQKEEIIETQGGKTGRETAYCGGKLGGLGLTGLLAGGPALRLTA